MKSWIWGIIMIVANAALWGMMLLLLFINPSVIGYVGFPLASILMIAYVFGVITDIQSYIDDKVEGKKDEKDKG